MLKTKPHSIFCAKIFLIIILAPILGLAWSSKAFSHDPKRFSDVKHWEKIFEDPARDSWQKPDDVIRWLGVNSKDTWADLGAGTGYFSIRLAKLATEGKVFALDSESTMVNYLRARAKKERLENLFAVRVPRTIAKLPVWVDNVLLVNTYHHIPNPVEYFKRLRVDVRKRLIVIDFTPSSPIGPPVKHRVPQQVLIEDLEKAGWQLSRSASLLPNQYCLEFTPNL